MEDGARLVGFVVGLALTIGIGVWLYKDAKDRGANAPAWALAGWVFGVFALAAWLVVRPRRKSRRGALGTRSEPPAP